MGGFNSQRENPHFGAMPKWEKGTWTFGGSLGISLRSLGVSISGVFGRSLGKDVCGGYLWVSIVWEPFECFLENAF